MHIHGRHIPIGVTSNKFNTNILRAIDINVAKKDKHSYQIKENLGTLSKILMSMSIVGRCMFSKFKVYDTIMSQFTDIKVPKREQI